MASSSNYRDGDGKLLHGCEHYLRRCKIRAPCCGQIFTCRLCHDEAMPTHNIDRHAIKNVICALCNTEQEVAQRCINCKVLMGAYFCEICKLYDDDVSKEQFHCTDCGICRQGGRARYYHCQICDSCQDVDLRTTHLCFANSVKDDCILCMQSLFESTNETKLMACGHALHAACQEKMLRNQRYRCPMCKMSMVDMTASWRLVDMEIEARARARLHDVTRQVRIMCYDCRSISTTAHNYVAHKCNLCNSYNTELDGNIG